MKQVFIQLVSLHLNPQKYENMRRNSHLASTSPLVYVRKNVKPQGTTEEIPKECAKMHKGDAV